MPGSLLIYTLGLNNPHLEGGEDSGILTRTFLHEWEAWLEGKLERKEHASPLEKNREFGMELENGTGIKTRTERDLESPQDNLSNFVRGAVWR